MRTTPATRSWVAHALQIVRGTHDDAVTPLVELPLPAEWGIRVVAKDESSHPTGSLKHRLARSLFLHAIVDGQIGPSTTVIEASSGSTAVSEAYFAQALGLPFVAVVPRNTSSRKIALIEALAGRVHFVSNPGDMAEEARRLAQAVDGHFMDQFANASRVTDWLGDGNLAGELFHQLSTSSSPVPTWVVVGAGTGGTSAMMGRYCRGRNIETRIALADPEGSAYFPRVASRIAPTRASRIEGIGRPAVEASFVPSVIDEAFQVRDAHSVAAMRLFGELTGRACGPSTGTNLVVALHLVARLRARGQKGTIATLLCDGADRYADTYYDGEWLAAHDVDPTPHMDALRRAATAGTWDDAILPVLSSADRMTGSAAR